MSLKRLWKAAGLSVGALILLMMLPTAWATPTPFTQCPAVGASPSCSILITVGPGESLTVEQDTNVGPYDGVEDSLVGIVNNSGVSVASIHLSANTDLFGFDGDGIQVFGSPANTVGDTTGYAGPDNIFGNINANFTAGDVIFPNGLADGASSFFSLEESPDTLIGGGLGGGGGPTVPEPSSLLMLGFGLLVMAGALRRRRSS